MPCCKQNAIIMFTNVVEIAPTADAKPKHTPLAFVGNS